jgi:hypothetical protein
MWKWLCLASAWLIDGLGLEDLYLLYHVLALDAQDADELALEDDDY